MSNNKLLVQDQAQPLVAHLIELRQRLLYCLITIILVFFSLYYFANELYSWVAKPLSALLPPQSKMIATDITGPFLAPFKLSFAAAIIISIPIILYQLWAFIAPGLYKKEKRFAIPLLVSSVLLFYLGLAFAYYVVFPLIFKFFTTVGPSDVVVMTDINQYLSFVLSFFVIFGFIFEIPIATALLVKTQLVSIQTLNEKRPYIIILCFIIGMILTPPDVLSQTLLAIPMWLLFEVGLVLSYFLTIHSKPSDRK